MVDKIRVFGYAGTVQLEQRMLKSNNAESVFVAQEPYEWSVVLVLNGATPVQMPVQANDKATLIRIEVPDSKTIRYEIQPNGPIPTARVAGDGSPRLSGVDLFQWFSGATVSIIDAANFP